MISIRNGFSWLLFGVMALVLAYLLVPLGVILLASFTGSGYLTFPPQGLSLRWYRAAFADPQYLNGLLVSLRIGGIVAAGSLVAGCTAAIALTRYRSGLSATIEAVLLSPLAMPALILAVALSLFLSNFPEFGQGTMRLILAQIMVGTALVLRVLLPVLRKTDPFLEEAAQNLGASPVKAFFLVTVPVLRPGMLAAAALAFIYSFDEFDMALFLSSPRAAPLTVVLYGAAQMALDPTVAAVSTLLIALVVGAFCLHRVFFR